jgi:hypothetical protein
MCRYLAPCAQSRQYRTLGCHDRMVSPKKWAAGLVAGYWVLVLAAAVFVSLATRAPGDGLAGVWLFLVTLPGSILPFPDDLDGTAWSLALTAVGFVQGALAYVAFILLTRWSNRP